MSTCCISISFPILATTYKEIDFHLKSIYLRSSCIFGILECSSKMTKPPEQGHCKNLRVFGFLTDMGLVGGYQTSAVKSFGKGPINVDLTCLEVVTQLLEETVANDVCDMKQNGTGWHNTFVLDASSPCLGVQVKSTICSFCLFMDQ